MKNLLVIRIDRSISGILLLLLLVLGSTATRAQCVPTPSGLVSWWPAEGDGTDAVGLNSASIWNSLTFGFGEVGLAFNFDGTANYAVVPASATLDVGQGPGFTIEGW